MRDPNPIKKIISEEFNSYQKLLETIKARPNGPNMKNQYHAEKNDESFTGTESYEKAEQLMVVGFTEILPKLKKSIETQKKLNAKFEAQIKRPIPTNMICGYVPNIPNAIQGIPQSMIGIDRKPIKRKTMSITYSIGANCGTNSKDFIKAGTALLSAIDIIEKHGIYTKLKVCFFPTLSDNGLTFTYPTLKIKNYDERYSLQKISFPIAHTSVFRRFGFKWVETHPNIPKGFSVTYGHSPEQKKWPEIESLVCKERGEYLINMNWILENNCSVEEILKKVEVL